MSMSPSLVGDGGNINEYIFKSSLIFYFDIVYNRLDIKLILFGL